MAFDQTDDLFGHAELVDALVKGVVRGNYRTVRIAVKDGKVRITAPSNYPERDIRKFVEAKLDWLSKAVRKTKQEASRPKAYASDICDGGRVYVYGNPVKIVAKPDVVMTELNPDNPSELFVKADPNDMGEIYNQVVIFLKFRFYDLVKSRATVVMGRMNLTPKTIKPSDAKTRWGSCSIKGGIMLSWRLACLPVECFDYVVTHELAHLVHFNHSIDFWNKVEEYCPDYEHWRAILMSTQIKALI